jgi:hypothetical protein
MIALPLLAVALTFLLLIAPHHDQLVSKLREQVRNIGHSAMFTSIST